MLTVSRVRVTSTSGVSGVIERVSLDGYIGSYTDPGRQSILNVCRACASMCACVVTWSADAVQGSPVFRARQPRPHLRHEGETRRYNIDSPVQPACTTYLDIRTPQRSRSIECL